MTSALVGGHTDSVLCVTAGPDGRLFSGGEGGELCMWSLGGPVQLHKVVVPPISPTTESAQGEEEESRDVTSVCCSKLNPHQFYASCGRHVLEYDVRKLNEPVHTLSVNAEEINQLSLNEKETHLAACDDSGDIKVICTQERRVLKTLRRHDNICASVAFRPNRASELVSGGYDNMVMLWDYTKGKNQCSIDMGEFVHAAGDSETEVQRYCVNPPFVHSVALSRDAGGGAPILLAAGTDNALVHVFDASKRQLVHLRTLRHHTDGVSQVCFVDPLEGTAAAVPATSQTTWLVSAGNDGKIAFWDAMLDPTAADDSMANGHSASGKKGGKGKNARKSQPNLPSSAYLKAEIDHGEKVNWVTSCLNQGHVQIAVADSSNKISLYPLPV